MNKSFDEIFIPLIEQMTEAIQNKKILLAKNLWIHGASLPLSFYQLTKVTNLGKKIIELKKGQEAPKNPIRLALLGNTTINHLKSALLLNSEMRGYPTEIYEGLFNNLEQDIYNPESDLYKFNPTHILLFSTDDVIGADTSLGNLKKNTTEELDGFWNKTTGLWSILSERLPKCQILQATFAIPALRPAGHLETKLFYSKTSFLSKLNEKMRTEAPKSVSILDLDYLSSYFGKERWFDSRFWHHSKHAFSLDAIALVSNEIQRTIMAGLGHSYKCLVLDLDNTLWGGVIGDDDLDGIQLGETPVGEAFHAFQRYIKSLKDRGVILAVCSKNNIENAKSPFLKHAFMVLKENDIACFIANWDNKADNIRTIAETLDIGIDSLVFCDDNPAERKLVRDHLPEVFTVELPQDPSDYPSLLDCLGLFDIAQLTEEDFERAEQYKANSDRKVLASKITSLEDFLKDLKMKGYVQKVSSSNMERPLQLINKSNQFNLVTNRYGLNEFQDLLSHPHTAAVALRLTDRFGDNGTIAVIVTQKEDDQLTIKDWVMSCRVLSRGMEQFTFNVILNLAESLNVKRIHAVYRPTKKNSLVSKLLSNLGFQALDKTQEEERYALELLQAKPFQNHIETCMENN